VAAEAELPQQPAEAEAFYRKLPQNPKGNTGQ